MELAAGKNPELKSGELTFTSLFPASKLRRCSRYQKLAVAAAGYAGQDGKMDGETDMARVGTILSTGFGATESNIAFSDSVATGNPAECSPTIFSGTVTNSCVGQVCILNGFKGCSTVLTGGDPMEYSALLLSQEKADVIFCGSVEEYSEELFRSLKAGDILADTDISEGTVMMTVRAEQAEHAYCKAVGFASAALPAYPYVHKIDGSCAADISRVVSRLCGEKKPDVVFTSENGTYFDAMEKEALKKVLETETVYAAPKKLFGETLGSSYMLGVALAAASLKEGNLPKGIASGTVECLKRILVTGLDTAGNYCCMLLEVC
jgi:3-oxoacyl-(acyl-carrier-protein) synthase